MMAASENEGNQLREFMDNVVRNHGPGWVRFVRRVVRNQADAEDAVQEAVRRVLTRNRPFASSEDVRMYLGRAVSNTAIELYHQRQRDRERLRPIRDNALARVSGATPQDCLEQRESAAQHTRLLAILNDALSKLPAKQYEAVRLTVLEAGETSIRDAGNASGIPYSTLRHRSMQGLRQLRKYACQEMRKAGERQSLRRPK
jgi:RNA polymerase sigma-70 factor, ECF subfamily